MVNVGCPRRIQKRGFVDVPLCVGHVFLLVPYHYPLYQNSKGDCNRLEKDQNDRTVEHLEIEDIRAILQKDAIARGIDMADKEVKFFASRYDGFLGARIMRRKP